MAGQDSIVGIVIQGVVQLLKLKLHDGHDGCTPGVPSNWRSREARHGALEGLREGLHRTQGCGALR